MPHQHDAMCFSQSSKFCVICLILHTLTTCLPVLGLKGHDLSTTSTTESSRFYDQLKPMAAPLEDSVGSDPDHHDGNRTNLTETHGHLTEEELIQWRNYYIKNLFNKYSSDNVLKFDGLIHMLEHLGIDPLVLQGHSHVGHSHVTNDKHSSHSHDSDHDKHIHDSEHDKHKPETDHQHSQHGGLDHQHGNIETDHDHHDHDHSHDHNGDHHENHVADDEYSSHNHDSDHDKHIHDSEHDKHKLETDHQANHHRGLDHQHNNTETDHDHHNHDHDEAYHHVHNNESDHFHHHNSDKSNVETNKHLHDHNHGHNGNHENHVANDEHSSHSHDSDHEKHIHDSEHDKHKPETDHQDNHHGGLDHQHDNTETDHDQHNHDHDGAYHHVNNNGSDHLHHSNSSKSNVETDKHLHDHNHDHNGEHHHEHTHAGNHSDILQRHERFARTLPRQDSDHFEPIEPEEGKCDNQNLLDRFNIHEDDVVSEERFLQLCPAILSTLVTPKCLAAPSHDHHDDHHLHPEKQSVYTSLQDIPAEVWGYSTVSILIISLVGLLGVAVIPIMQKVFYNHLLQFLVALAVGALSGDAMLHLLPHALIGGHDHSSHDNSGHGNHDDSGHKEAVFKGLCGLAGIFLFFTMERVLSIVTDLKRKQKKNGAVFVKDTGEVVEDGTNIPLTECGAMRVTDTDCKEQVMGIHPGQKALANFAESSHKKCSRNHNNSDSNKDGRFEMIDEENPSSVLSHSHKHHGHSHILPNSVAAIAWMVILGDGIHNFSDGLAIGAAFSSSITGGFSTSIAVFCHELPHEIGDFAVLLRAGMTVKQAVMYNCVSSILAFIGVMIGVAIGNFGQANAWVFISVAGMFLYIALVDMLPELMSVDTRQGEHPFSHLFLQVIGMILGATIMFLIALYEDRLLLVLEPV